jgi:hypothetical protein
METNGLMAMRKLIVTAILTILISARTTAAQISLQPGPSLDSGIAPVTSMQPPITVGQAPIGHRQPKIRDVPTENPSDLERRGDEDTRIDRKLIICRGC